MLKLIQLFDNDNFFKKIRLSNNKLNIGYEIKQIQAKQYFLSCDTTRKNTIYLVDEETLQTYHEPIQQLITSNVIVFIYNDENIIYKSDSITETADFYLSYNYDTIDLYSILRQSRNLLLGHTKTEFSRKLFSSSVSEIEQIINDSAQRIFWKNTDGRYIGCNKLFAQDFGINDVEKIIGKTDHQLLPEKSALNLSAYDSEIIKTGETFEFSKEVKFGNKDKKILNIKKYPHLKGGVIIGIIGKYELIEKHLENQKEELNYSKINEIITDNISELYFVKDTACNFIALNRKYADFLGIENKSKALGKNDFDFFDSETAKKYFTEEQKLLFDGDIYTDIVVKTTNNKNKEYVFVKVPILNEKNIITGIVGIGTLNNVFKKNNISNLLSKMGHDIRTPMNGIMGMSEVLLMDHLHPEQTQMVEIIQSSGIKLLSLIDDAIAIGRLELSSHKRGNETFNIRTLLESISYLFKTNNTNSLSISLNNNVPLKIYGEKERIQEAINLILKDIDSKLTEQEIVIQVDFLNKNKLNAQECLSFKISKKENIEEVYSIDDYEHMNCTESCVTKQFSTESLKLINASILITQTNGRLLINNKNSKHKIYLIELPCNSPSE